jgi:hypothetical protein
MLQSEDYEKGLRGLAEKRTPEHEGRLTTGEPNWILKTGE